MTPGSAIAILVLLAALPAIAQRQDGCPTPEAPVATTNTLDNSEVRSGLRALGISPTPGALLEALQDPRPDARSLAALQLVAAPEGAPLAPLLKAWSAEPDECGKWIIHHALSLLVSWLSYDPAQHPAGRRWITPFQACTAPARPVVQLSLDQAGGSTDGEVTLRITARNETPETIAFVGTWSPQEIFSASVIGPWGQPAAVRNAAMYQPLASAGPMVTTHGRVFVPLPPNEDVVWHWKVTDDFDMSEPGTYQVSLGGRVPYLGTTICSNTLRVEVGK